MAFFSHFSIASSLPSLAAIPALLFSRFCIDASKASFCFLVARSPNGGRVWATDRKSTRLNSIHRCISYGVFCLEKEREKRTQTKLTLALSVLFLNGPTSGSC